MKARVTKQCMGDRNCNKLCPEVFKYDEDQLAPIEHDAISFNQIERRGETSYEMVQ